MQLIDCLKRGELTRIARHFGVEVSTVTRQLRDPDPMRGRAVKRMAARRAIVKRPLAAWYPDGVLAARKVKP